MNSHPKSRSPLSLTSRSNSNEISITLAVREISFESIEYQHALELRREILRRPLGMEFTSEELRPDQVDHHFAAFTSLGRLVGCLTLSELSAAELKMRQVAVMRELQRQGVGQSLVAAAELWARQNGHQCVVLHAREAAVRFYEKLGYEVFAEPFVEKTLPHRKMRKILL